MRQSGQIQKDKKDKKINMNSEQKTQSVDSRRQWAKWKAREDISRKYKAE